ncbi:hypothetical protein [Nocardia pseudobrasiliensis]|uniref:WXG100 family type VII secretion target n=1 Tax=Nocardia pseudobrasiliensis TaxID=45979 RepID=A0A370I1J0_9NOCA|nr:hypothetical protein [Nocardia pseudobrasiliensis]RDI64440.1 hypothetical protein DFR76_108273 [Nocardia pseudobrasiliensis]
MTDNPYPNLGFNPVPGAPNDVTALSGKINSAATAVKETNDLLTRLRNSNDEVWQGEGGDAFRSHFDSTLAQDLGYAQNSLERAVDLLGQWNTGLVGFQDTAKGLETEAAEARGQHAQAVAALQQAQSNPDLGLANQQFTDATALANAQSRLDAANNAVRTANTNVTHWQGQIDSILQRAHDLAGEHDKLSRKIAAELDTAAKDFAPSPPDKGIWDSIVDAVKGVGKFISDHRQAIHDILAGVSAVTGLLALLTPPPFDFALGAIALLSGAGALALDAMDPEVRQAFTDVTSDLIDNHTINTDAAKKLGMTVGTDALSMIPGVGGAYKGVNSLREVGELGTAMKAFTEGAQAPSAISKGLNRIPLPGEATVWLQDFSQASKWQPGTALSGIELFSRSAKAGLGMEKIGSAIGSVFGNED